ncbi:hypothetical protein [Leuconostoc mesenteroides]|uniref:hypothetical protein n=1 Tax=Leuconostoc mesenteroides TaxID=1245 RepID=UPI002361B5A1|nr:hypothetical protein [Leuconostoc mesenteroides]
MTFDEATNLLLEQNLDNEVASLVVYEMSVLKDTYAPTVEMTQTQYDYIAPLIKQGKELGATFTEFWEVYKFIGASKKIDRTFDSQEQAMQAWLHPETIKIVDE